MLIISYQFILIVCIKNERKCPIALNPSMKWVTGLEPSVNKLKYQDKIGLTKFEKYNFCYFVKWYCHNTAMAVDQYEVLAGWNCMIKTQTKL